MPGGMADFAVKGPSDLETWWEREKKGGEGGVEGGKDGYCVGSSGE